MTPALTGLHRDNQAFSETRRQRVDEFRPALAFCVPGAPLRKLAGFSRKNGFATWGGWRGDPYAARSAGRRVRKPPEARFPACESFEGTEGGQPGWVAVPDPMKRGLLRESWRLRGWKLSQA